MEELTVKVVKRTNEIALERLLDVYADEFKSAAERESFYMYLLEYFSAPDCCYFLLVCDDQYVSVLRTERYRDGYLITGLHTKREFRSRGFGKQILTEACGHLRSSGNVAIYSHVENTNAASIRVHLACGFKKELEYASFIDGSISWNSCTLILK